MGNDGYNRTIDEFCKNIYSTVPNFKDPAIEDKELLKVIEILRENRHRFMCVKDIAKLADLPTSSTCVKARKIITILIEEYSMPIISTNEGFMLTDKISMIVAYQESLRSRIKGIQRRVDALNRASNVIMRKMRDV